jgi:hypothetical protein
MLLQLELSPIEVALTGSSGEIHWDAPRPDGQPPCALDMSWARELSECEPRCRLIDGLPRPACSNGAESRC